MFSSYTVIRDSRSEWGALYLPKVPKTIKNEGLRIVLFVSCDCGDLMIRNLAHFEDLYPDKLNIVGVVTDDPIDPAARISIKKRIWSQFPPESHQGLLQKIIDSAIRIGVPCYTGAVKTEYFREIFRAWNPEALFMFCFGQRIDKAVFEYPVMGSYNFHPSDLPKKEGAGTQPFQNAIKNGRKTSPLVIHEVTEIIDVGPIIGVSPPVNICLKDGSYPYSILTLLDKITSLGGWMGIALADAIINRKESGKTGTVEPLDFDQLMPDDVKAVIYSPAVDDLNEKYEIPLHPLLKRPVG